MDWLNGFDLEDAVMSSTTPEKTEGGITKVVLVGSKQNYLLSAIRERLDESFMEVELCLAHIDHLGRACQNAQILVVYGDPEMINNRPFMVYMKDLVVEHDLAVFVIGSREEMASVREALPEHMIQKEYERPIDVRVVSKDIVEYEKTSHTVAKKKILVVDDSSVMLHSLKGWLGGKYHITLADSGVSAIKCLSLNKPDLILLDYEMPVVNGKQVMEMIHSEPEFANIPIIFLTGTTDRDTVLSIMKLKPAGYLLKKTTPSEIMAALDEFFKNH